MPRSSRPTASCLDRGTNSASTSRTNEPAFGDAHRTIRLVCFQGQPYPLELDSRRPVPEPQQVSLAELPPPAGHVRGSVIVESVLGL
ncbi:MAG: hypothetical protein ACRDRH_13265 [Pseudonocardia sp.]